MPHASNIWIIDDDPEVRRIFKYALSQSGYAVSEYRNGLEALEQLESNPAELIILDVDMPKLNGWKTLAELRARGCTQPVLMITGVNDIESRVRGLELGADDYIGKPCLAPELLARVRALLRRTVPPWTTTTSQLRHGDVRIDLENKTATKAGEPLRLTRTDYALLKLLHENQGKPVSREIILRDVWESQSGNSHALDTHLWRLRSKIGDNNNGAQWIQNIPGIGFMMSALH